MKLKNIMLSVMALLVFAGSVIRRMRILITAVITIIAIRSRV